MNKNLTATAECVDVRSGRRFQAGEEFDPAPTVEQAQRLVKAGCLPEGAIDEAKKAEAAAEKKAAGAEKQANAEHKAKLDAAKKADHDAREALKAAEKALKDADGDEQKKAAEETVAAARTKVEETAKTLGELNG